MRCVICTALDALRFNFCPLQFAALYPLRSIRAPRLSLYCATRFALHAWYATRFGPSTASNALRFKHHAPRDALHALPSRPSLNLAHFIRCVSIAANEAKADGRRAVLYAIHPDRAAAFHAEEVSPNEIQMMSSTRATRLV